MVECEKNSNFSAKDDKIAKAYLKYGTMRQVEYHIGLSKTTVHKVISRLIKQKKYPDWKKLYQLVEKNKKERCSRGGIAVWQKFKQL